MSGMFTQAADELKGIKMAERDADRIRRGKCDWRKGEDVALAASVENAAERLRMRPKDGCCPNCRLYVEGRWVYECEGGLMCWSCNRVGGGKAGVRVSLEGVGLTGEVVRACRERRCWSRGTLGKKVGRSGAWVQKVESGGVKLDGKVGDLLRAVLEGE